MPYKFVNRHDWGENLKRKGVKEKQNRKFKGGGRVILQREMIDKRICQFLMGLFSITT